MKLQIISLFCFFIFLSSTTTADETERGLKQKELDTVCEAAREMKLAPLRQQYVEECIENQKKDRAYCERFYSDYGQRIGNKPALFYELPECVEAFDFQKSYRQAK